MSSVDNVPGAGGIEADTVEITLAFDQATVDLDALQRSAYAVAAVMTVDIHIFGTDYVCTLFPRKRHDADDLKHRFRAEVNDQILRIQIAKETEQLRNLVFALAFSQTGLVDEAEGTTC
jgi:His-Xaa-Ser system protein HxsD